jgi:hypothetical protein
VQRLDELVGNDKGGRSGLIRRAITQMAAPATPAETSKRRASFPFAGRAWARPIPASANRASAGGPSRRSSGSGRACTTPSAPARSPPQGWRSGRKPWAGTAWPRVTAPAGLLLGELAADVVELQRVLARRHTASALRRLTRITAQLAGLMFLTLIKLDVPLAARNWARTARVAADEAGDPPSAPGFARRRRWCTTTPATSPKPSPSPATPNTSPAPPAASASHSPPRWKPALWASSAAATTPAPRWTGAILIVLSIVTSSWIDSEASQRRVLPT